MRRLILQQQQQQQQQQQPLQHGQPLLYSFLQLKVHFERNENEI